MKTKTWAIGEYCKGGVISVEITDTDIHIIGRQWPYGRKTKNDNHNDDPEWSREIISIGTHKAFPSKVRFELEDLTTSYYADQIMTWIEEHIPVPQSHWDF